MSKVSMAWETTYDDIVNVLGGLGIYVSDERIDEILDFQIDHDAVEHEALRAVTMDRQTEYAHEEIKKQLKASGVIK